MSGPYRSLALSIPRRWHRDGWAKSGAWASSRASQAGGPSSSTQGAMLSAPVGARLSVPRDAVAARVPSSPCPE